MKAFNIIVKLLAALAAVLGGIYILATYGEKIVAWAKTVVIHVPDCPCCKDAEPAEEAAEAVTEEAAPEEAPVEEPAPEILVSKNEPVAEETDFAE